MTAKKRCNIDDVGSSDGIVDDLESGVEEPTSQSGDLASMRELYDQPVVEPLMPAGCGLHIRNLHQSLFQPMLIYLDLWI